jgi:hypothetical protein
MKRSPSNGNDQGQSNGPRQLPELTSAELEAVSGGRHGVNRPPSSSTIPR